MHRGHRAVSRRHRRVRTEVQRSDSYAFFNLLTGEDLLDDVEALLPAHRERLFPPTETLSMFLAQVLSNDGSCRQAVDDAGDSTEAVVGVPVGLKPDSTAHGAGGFPCRPNPAPTLFQAHRTDLERSAATRRRRL
jgi:hypothetical protein